VALPPNKGPVRPGSAASKLAQPTPEEVAQAARHQTDQLTDESQKIEEELEALKAKYEQFFLGNERREPVRWREDVRKKVLHLKAAFTRNAGLRFRIQSLHARYLSYERLWMRSAREKEEGTYRRDLFKARLRAPDAKAAATPATGAAAPATTAPAVKAPATPPRPAAPGGPAPAGDAQLRALYDAYVAAKKRCGEDVSRLTYDAVAKSVSKQVPELMAKYKAKSVDFKVEVKDGKAVLKAIPKV
jgi:hypothetical protein